MKIFFATAATLLLASCASRRGPIWEPGRNLASANAGIAPVPAPKTIRIEGKVRLRSRGRTMNFDAVVVADSSRGRMEALGPFGMSLATLVWQDTSWTVWLPSQGAIVSGSGDSLSLPVVGMRTLRPRELLAPFQGRAISVATAVPMRRLAQDKTNSVFVPMGHAPGWSVAIDRSTGLPAYRQVFRNGRESERIRYGAWSLRDGVPVPDSLIRTGRDSQEFVLRLTSWEALDSLPASALSLSLEKAVDTILVVRDGAGRRRYRIHPAGGAPGATETVDSLPGDDEESIEEPTDDDSTAELDEDSTSSPEDDLPAE